MSYRIKIASKDRPADELPLRSATERLLDTLQERRRTILAGVAVFVVAAAGLLALGWYDQRRAQEGLELERQATRLYATRPLDQPEKAEEQLKKAIELYRQVVTDYSRTDAAAVALFRLGNALAQLNDTGGAIDAYTQFIKQYGANRRLLGLVYQRLAYAHLLKGDREQAAKAFSAVLDLPDALNKDQVFFELGKLEETLSRPEGALARYQELMKAYPQSPFASEAAVRMKALEVKKTPAPSDAPTSPEPGSLAPKGKPTP